MADSFVGEVRADGRLFRRIPGIGLRVVRGVGGITGGFGDWTGFFRSLRAAVQLISRGEDDSEGHLQDARSAYSFEVIQTRRTVSAAMRLAVSEKKGYEKGR